MIARFSIKQRWFGNLQVMQQAIDNKYIASRKLDF